MGFCFRDSFPCTAFARSRCSDLEGMRRSEEEGQSTCFATQLSIVQQYFSWKTTALAVRPYRLGGRSAERMSESMADPSPDSVVLQRRCESAIQKLTGARRR
jgi:hypothetical protein